jgi:NAD(P)-dependent dehydrogenase (short-subunit alcohol dehydrogenase family)
MKTVLITGANRGIGLELAKQLQQKDYRVIVACRNTSDELAALNCQVEQGFDVANTESIKTLAKKLKGQSIDLLINNAGILEPMSLEQTDYDGMRRQFEINAIGPLKVTQNFLSHLHKGAKVAIVTSRMGSVSDNTSGGQYGYRASKAAANMIGMSLAQDLKSKDIAVALLHPGYVRTGMTGGNGLMDADESAAGLIKVLEKLNIENTGGFWHTDGSVLPW